MRYIRYAGNARDTDLMFTFAAKQGIDGINCMAVRTNSRGGRRCWPLRHNESGRCRFQTKRTGYVGRDNLSVNVFTIVADNLGPNRSLASRTRGCDADIADKVDLPPGF